MILVSLAAAFGYAKMLLLFTIKIYTKPRYQTLTSKSGCMSWIGNLLMKYGNGYEDW